MTDEQDFCQDNSVLSAAHTPTDGDLVDDGNGFMIQLSVDEEHLMLSCEDVNLPSPMYYSDVRPLAVCDDFHTFCNNNSLNTTTCEIETDDKKTELEARILRLEEELWLLRNCVNDFHEEIATRFSKIDLKKIKKNRTLLNRCRFTNRKKHSCKGYICKISGSTLCYAHHIMATSDQNSLRRSKLY